MAHADWKKISRFDGPERSTGFLLWRVSTLWRRRIEAVLAKIGLTHPQFVLLACLGWLSRDGGRVTQAELARHCATDLTMTSQVLRTLEKRGLLKREQMEGDARSKYPILTKEGIALVKRAVPLVEEMDHAFFEHLGKDSIRFGSNLRALSMD